MSETPGSPEYYTPSSEPPPAPPPPPSISDAAQQWTLAQDGSAGDPQYGAAAPYAYAQPSAAQQPYGYAPPPPPRPAPQGLAITSLVLGIIAFVTGWIPVWGILIGLVAILLGVIALAKRQTKGMAITGIITGALGAIASAFMLAFVIIGWDASDDYYQDDYGYGSGTTTLSPESVNGGLAVQEQAFGPASWDEEMSWFVVILDNPSDHPYNSADITVNALDESGAVVDSAWTYLTLPAGQTAITGTFFELEGATVASLQVVGPGVDSLASEPASGVLTTSALTVTSDEWFTSVSGTVTSSFDADVLGASGVIVARDASGQIIAGTDAWLEGALGAGESAGFDSTFYDVLPPDAVFEAYWTSY